MACDLRHQSAALVGILSAHLLLCATDSYAQAPRPISDLSFRDGTAAQVTGFSPAGPTSLRGTNRQSLEQPTGNEKMEFVFVTDDETIVSEQFAPPHSNMQREPADGHGVLPFSQTLSKLGLPSLRFLNGSDESNRSLESSSIAVVGDSRMTPADARRATMRDENVVPASHNSLRSPHLQTRGRRAPSPRPSSSGYSSDDHDSQPSTASLSRTGSMTDTPDASIPGRSTLSEGESRHATRVLPGSSRSGGQQAPSSPPRNVYGVMSAAKRRSAANAENRPLDTRPATGRPLPLRPTTAAAMSTVTPAISQPPQIAAQSRQRSPVVGDAGGVIPASMLRQRVARSISQPTPAPPKPPRPRLTQSRAPQLQRTPTGPQSLTPAQQHVRELIVEIHRKAHAAESEDEFTHIVESCRRALAIEPKGEAAEYAKQLCAWALNRRGQFKADRCEDKQAMLDFEDALRLDPKLWRAIHNRGVLRAQAGHFESAFDDFNRCTELNPHFAKAYSNRAALFVQARDLLAALQDYRRAIQLDPDLAVAHKGRGRVCHMLGSLEEALYHFDAAAQLAPEDAHVIASRADLLVDLGRYAGASEEYRRAIQLDENLAHAYRSSAWLLATCPDDSVRDAKQALVDAQRAIELDESDNAVSFDTLAAAQANDGNFEAAVETVARAVAIAPEAEQKVYLDRMDMYRKAKPYRIQPVSSVSQVSFSE